MKHSFLIFLLLIAGLLKTYAQNLTGTWRDVNHGYLIAILHINDSCFGYTYDTGFGYCKANFKGRYNDSTKKLKGLNTDFIERTFAHGLSSYQLAFSEDTDGEYLKGKASPRQAIVKVFTLGAGIPVAYKKISPGIDTTSFIAAKLAGYKLKPLVSPQSDPTANKEIRQLALNQQVFAEVSRQKDTRKSQIVDTIETDADSLRLLLYDNGEIDNDTVTVFHNGKIIINRIGLTVKPYESIIPINITDSMQSVELMANNLGSIPPNTAFLTIWAGKQKYELRVSSDYTLNARIDIRYKTKK